MTNEEAIKALRLINLSKVHPFLTWDEMADVRDVAIEALKKQNEIPTVDTVSVVRCKDCKFYDSKEDIGWCEINSHFKDGYWNSFESNDFCSYGERRKDFGGE